MLTLILEGERPISWNKFWAMRHWSERSREKQRVQQLVRAALPYAVLNGEGYPLREPVAITVTAYMDKRLIDADNLCTKIYVDALKGWVIEDDDPAHVVQVTPVIVYSATWPRIEIKVVEYDSETECVDGRRGRRLNSDRAGGAGGLAVVDAETDVHAGGG